MQRTRIEWVKNQDGSQGYTINPVKGLCPVDCRDNQGKSYCYARRMYKRFKWNPEIRFEPETMLDLAIMKANSRVFIGSTFELFHDSIPHEWLEKIFWYVKRAPWITCIFLTKQPQNLIEWSPFPTNCWIGVSVTNREQAHTAFGYLPLVNAKVKFISFEPLLDDVTRFLYFLYFIESVQWIIIGQQTPVKKTTMPKIEWVKKIVEAVDKTGIQVFLKNNLYSLWYNKTNNGSNQIPQWATSKNYHEFLRQEFPSRK